MIHRLIDHIVVIIIISTTSVKSDKMWLEQTPAICNMNHQNERNRQIYQLLQSVWLALSYCWKLFQSQRLGRGLDLQIVKSWKVRIEFTAFSVPQVQIKVISNDFDHREWIFHFLEQILNYSLMKNANSVNCCFMNQWFRII